MKFTINSNNQLDIVVPEKPTLLLKSSWENSSYQYSVIKRFQVKRGRGRQIGDNCPILYALKKLDGLSVSEDTREHFFEYVEQCIKHHFKDRFPFDTIVVMPSKHDIGSTIADIISRTYKVNVIYDYLAKNSPELALDEINKMNIDVKIKDSLKTAISRDMDNLSLKKIRIGYRKYVPILTPKITFIPVLSERVLLIDDIVASGTTLKLARDLIMRDFPQLKTVDSLVLFSKLSNKG